MDCGTSGSITMCGNFAEREDTKPKDYYDRTAKWWEDYPLEWREKIGNVICNCQKIKVDYAPYYGFDYYHDDKCNLMKAIKDKPQLAQLPPYQYLPAIVIDKHAVPVSKGNTIYVSYHDRIKKILVKNYAPQGVLL